MEETLLISFQLTACKKLYAPTRLYLYIKTCTSTYAHIIICMHAQTRIHTFINTYKHIHI